MTDELMTAAYAYVDSVVDTADTSPFGFPLWHGWALRQAFIAGAEYVGTPRHTLTDTEIQAAIDSVHMYSGSYEMAIAHAVLKRLG